MFACGAEATAQIDAAITKKMEHQALTPSGSPFTLNGLNSASIVTGLDGTVATVNLAGTLIGNEGRSVVFSADVSSPVNKNGTTIPLSLEGLNSDGRIKGSIQFNFWKDYPGANEIASAITSFNNDHGANIHSFLDLKTDGEKWDLVSRLDLGNPWFFGATGSIGQQDVEYATDNTFATIEEKTKYPLSGSAFVGFFAGEGLKYLFKASASYQRTFKENEANEYLVPFTTSTYIAKELIIGAPTQNEGLSLRGEAVVRFEKWGLNPSVTYRTSQNDFVLDVPLYLIQQLKDGKPAGLNGGVFGSYISSSDQRFAAGIFVGASLNTLGK